MAIVSYTIVSYYTTVRGLLEAVWVWVWVKHRAGGKAGCQLRTTDGQTSSKRGAQGIGDDGFPGIEHARTCLNMPEHA